MSEKPVEIISEDTARANPDITEEEISRAKTREDGYLCTLDGTRMYLSIQYNNLETGKRTVEMPDQVGIGRNRLKPGTMRADPTER